MKINPVLAKQVARRVCVVGLPLWRHMVSAAAAAAGSSSGNSRIGLAPAAIKQQLAVFAAQDSSYKAFLDQRENRSIAKHVATLLLLLSPTDDPLTIEGDIVTARESQPHGCCAHHWAVMIILIQPHGHAIVTSCKPTQISVL